VRSLVPQSMRAVLRRLWGGARRHWRWWLAGCVALLGLLAGGAFWLQARCRWEDVGLLAMPYSTVLRDRGGEILCISLSQRQEWRFHVSLAEVSPHLVDGVVAVEDQRFREHGGVDWRAVLRAARSNVSAGHIVSGASTISMQVVRLVRPGRRGWRDKLVQALRALDLEDQHDKSWIMEQYVNLLPFGGNVVGVEAASMRYFGKRAKTLTLAEAALLAGMPQRPNRFRPDRFPAAARRRRAYVLGRMVEEGMIAPAEAADAAAQVLPLVRRTQNSRMGLVSREPQFCRLALARGGQSGADLRTTLDPRAQEQVLAALRAGVARCAGAEDGAAVVLDVPTGHVRALVGTLDYWRPGDGQVNVAVAPRSPGSALKPFLYATAIEGGVMVPQTVVNDTPLSLPDYRPANYDQRYRGRVSMGDALRDSLNTPAVRVLLSTGVPRALDLLRNCGVRSLNRPVSEYGLALALGGGEVTPLDLTVAYSVLARGGMWLPARFLLDEARDAAPRRVLSPGVSSLVSAVLSERPLPGLVGHRVAWKTGTSNGLRDAWCAAYSRETAIVVWLGNKSGAAAASLVGAEAAVPVMADIAQRLFDDGGSRSPESSAGLVEAELCAETGLRAAPRCERRLQGQRPAGVPLVACSSCGAVAGSTKEAGVAILSPRPGVYRAERGGWVELPLRATGQGELSWFVDGRLVGRQVAIESQSFACGRHRVRCVAADGTTGDEVSLEVRAAD